MSLYFSKFSFSTAPHHCLAIFSIISNMQQQKVYLCLLVTSAALFKSAVLLSYKGVLHIFITFYNFGFMASHLTFFFFFLQNSSKICNYSC